LPIKQNSQQEKKEQKQQKEKKQRVKLQQGVVGWSSPGE
jgi:hypothetical protein